MPAASVCQLRSTAGIGEDRATVRGQVLDSPYNDWKSLVKGDWEMIQLVPPAESNLSV